jgi:putative PIN family toxin of toxin-antitoxin system
MYEMRVVVDTSVLFAGLYSRRGASHAVLRGCLMGRFTPVVTVPLAAEYEDVLRRPALHRASGLTAKDLDDFLDGFLAASDLVEVYFLWRPNLPDEADNMVLEAAVAGNAAAVVTHNIRDFVRGDLRFDQIRMVTPAVLLSGKGGSP